MGEFPTAQVQTGDQGARAFKDSQRGRGLAGYSAVAY